MSRIGEIRSNQRVFCSGSNHLWLKFFHHSVFSRQHMSLSLGRRCLNLSPQVSTDLKYNSFLNDFLKEIQQENYLKNKLENHLPGVKES